MKFELLRKQVDCIDKKILLLLKRRFNLSNNIGLIKRHNGTKIKDKKRESVIFTNLMKEADKLRLDKKLIEKIWILIIKQSRIKQKI